MRFELLHAARPLRSWLIFDVRQSMRIPGKRLSIIAAPTLLMVVSFYALAMHMYAAIGGWPKQIGEFGFPRPLVIHAGLTLDYFGIVFVSTFLVCPVAILICLLVPRWRSAIPYLLTHCGFFIAGMILMHIAPSEFINWWWD